MPLYCCVFVLIDGDIQSLFSLTTVLGKKKDKKNKKDQEGTIDVENSNTGAIKSKLAFI